MKKVLAFVLALILVLSFAACAESSSNEKKNDTTEEATTISSVVSKDDLLKEATPLGNDGYKAIGNAAFAKSLIGNTYTFDGQVISVEEEYVEIKFWVDIAEPNTNLYYWSIVGNVYLPLDELASLERNQILSFVGKITNTASLKQDASLNNGQDTRTELVFETAAIVSDRFEKTGILNSQNSSYGNNSWDIKLPDSAVLKLVYFRDDVSAYQGKEITFSYKNIDGKWEDAYIVE